MSFPPATEMFQFAGFASPSYVFRWRYLPKKVGFPIRIFPDQSLLAAPQDFSQPVTSFFASRCQGIHQMPFRRLIQLKTTRRERKAASPESEDRRPPDRSGNSAYGCLPCRPDHHRRKRRQQRTGQPPEGSGPVPDPCKVRRATWTRSVSEVLLERRPVVFSVR